VVGKLLGSLSDAALDESHERQPAMATGMTILDTTAANWILKSIVQIGSIFRDKLEKISSWSPVRSKQDAPETAPFGSAYSDPLVQIVSIYSRASSPASVPLLTDDQLIRPTQEDSEGRYRRTSA